MNLSIAIFLCLLLTACQHRECLRYETQMVVTYPYMGFLGMGGAYTGLALMPVMQPTRVCVEYKPKAEK